MDVGKCISAMEQEMLLPLYRNTSVCEVPREICGFIANRLAKKCIEQSALLPKLLQTLHVPVNTSVLRAGSAHRQPSRAAAELREPGP